MQPTESHSVQKENVPATLSKSPPSISLLRQMGRMVACFWLSRDWKFAWIGIVAIITISFLGVYVDLWFNQWERQLFDVLQKRDGASYPKLILMACVITVSGGITALASQFLYGLIDLRWRSAITRSFLTKWLHGTACYDLESARIIDNPDQRIAEDAKLIPNYGLQTLIGLLTASVSSISFGYVLLSTAPSLDISLFGTVWSVPGGLLTISLLYSLVGTLVIMTVGRPLVDRTVALERHEANFRVGMLSARRFAEQIAIARATYLESHGLFVRFESVYRTALRVIYAQIGLSAAQHVYSRVQGLLPIFLTIPRYFAGAISFGDVMAARGAFTKLTSDLSYLTQAYQGIATLLASLRRLRDLDSALHSLPERGIALVFQDKEEIRAQDVCLELPDGRRLLSHINWTVQRGERWLVRGSSGSGKSTLARAMGGLWRHGSGVLIMPRSTRIMFVPQNLYLTEGPLKDAVCFPDKASSHEDGVVRDALIAAGLGTHAGDLLKNRPWGEELSNGEKQRIALARIVLHRPDFLVLDEPTSALDPDHAQHFFETILRVLPDVTMVDISHSPALDHFHTHALAIHDGQAQLSPIATNDV